MTLLLVCFTACEAKLSQCELLLLNYNKNSNIENERIGFLVVLRAVICATMWIREGQYKIHFSYFSFKFATDVLNCFLRVVCLLSNTFYPNYKTPDLEASFYAKAIEFCFTRAKNKDPQAKPLFLSTSCEVLRICK